MKILLIKFRHIGDVLLSTPLIENLKKNHPEAQIDFALNQECAAILTDNPDISQLMIYDRKTIKQRHFFGRLWEEIKFSQRIHAEHYDWVINLTEGDRGAQLAFISGAGKKLGFPVRKGIFARLKIFNQEADDRLELHTVEKDMQFINMLGDKVFNKRVSVYWSEKEEKDVNDILKKNGIKEFVHIHPVSRWMFKCWEDDRMAAVIDHIQKNQMPVVITGAPVEKEQDRINKILKLCQTEPLNLSGQLTLKHLPCLSSKARFFFGVDTAPMHLAAAVDTPVIALFGASKVQCWGPWDNNTWKSYQPINASQQNGKHVAISRTDFRIFYEDGIKKCQGMRDIELHDVIAVIDARL